MESREVVFNSYLIMQTPDVLERTIAFGSLTSDQNVSIIYLFIPF